MAWDCC